MIYTQTCVNNGILYNTLLAHAAHTFVHGNIADRELVTELLTRHTIRAVVHLAAESHVDRSIHGPEEFIQTFVSTMGSLTKYGMRIPLVL